jgi:hypothetical protein
MSNPGCFAGDTTGTECFGYQGNNQKDNRVSQHGFKSSVVNRKTGNPKHMMSIAFSIGRSMKYFCRITFVPAAAWFMPGGDSAKNFKFQILFCIGTR